MFMCALVAVLIWIHAANPCQKRNFANRVYSSRTFGPRRKCPLKFNQTPQFPPVSAEDEHRPKPCEIERKFWTAGVRCGTKTRYEVQPYLALDVCSDVLATCLPVSSPWHLRCISARVLPTGVWTRADAKVTHNTMCGKYRHAQSKQICTRG